MEAYTSLITLMKSFLMKQWEENFKGMDARESRAEPMTAGYEDNFLEIFIKKGKE